MNGAWLVHTCRRDKLGRGVLPVLFCLVLGQAGHGTENWKGFGGSGDPSLEKARSLPLIGTCQDSRCFLEKTHMVHDLMSNASLLVDLSCAHFDASHVTGHEMWSAGPYTRGD